MSLRDLAKDKRRVTRQARTLTAREVRRIKKRGYDAERELVHMLRDAGLGAIRVPVSAPSNEPLPDVFAVKGDVILAFEVKSQVRYTYYRSEQVAKLFEFLEFHSLYSKRLAVLAAKFKYRDWAFLVADKIGDYVIRVGEGITFAELINLAV